MSAIETLDENGVIAALKADRRRHVYLAERDSRSYITYGAGHVPAQIAKALIDAGKLVDRYPDKPELNCYNLHEEAA